MFDNQVGHFAVHVLLNGKPEVFIVDTGAGATVIDEGYARSQGFELEEIDGFGGGIGNSQMSIFMVRINKLEIGDFTFENMTAVAMDLSNVKQSLEMKGVNSDVYGILGTDILRTYEAVIDYGSETLFLKMKD